MAHRMAAPRPPMIGDHSAQSGRWGPARLGCAGSSAVRRRVLPSAFAPGALPVPRAASTTHLDTRGSSPWPRRPAPGRAHARRRDSSASGRPQRRHEVLGPRRSAAKTYVAKALTVAASPADAETTAAALAEALSALDRAAKAGAIHPNAAARRKSRLTRKVNAALGGAHVQTRRPRREDDRQGRRRRRPPRPASPPASRPRPRAPRRPPARPAPR